jgi:glutamate racemase
MATTNAIGVFDSGYGGLTVLKEIVQQLPAYDYLYMGDNARAPYGTRSFETVYEYTLECVQWFFKQGCPIVVLACNTASAKALRTIQQKDLPRIAPQNKVLGVIRPTSEIIGQFSTTKNIGVLATTGTVTSNSYPIEIEKYSPGTKVFQQDCPMWVPLIENNEYEAAGADYFVQKNIDQLMAQSKGIDTVLLACTHYPLMIHKIQQFLPQDVLVLSQGEIVAKSLESYLTRHPEIETRLTRNGQIAFYTTDSTVDFDNHASHFYGQNVQSKHIDLGPKQK